MKHSRLTALILTILMLTGVFCQTASAAACGFSVDTVTAKAGETAEVCVRLSDNPGILGAIITMNYDSALTLEAAAPGRALSGLTMTPPGQFVSPCNFVWDGVGTPDTADGVLLTLTFRLPEDARTGAEYAVSVSLTEDNIIDGNLTPLVCRTTAGAIRVGASQSPVVTTAKQDPVTTTKPAATTTKPPVTAAVTTTATTATPETTVTVHIGEKTTALKTENGRLTLPAAPEAAEGTLFIGWEYNNGLYPAQAVLRVVAGKAVSAVFLKFSTAAAVGLRLDGEEDEDALLSGIAFETVADSEGLAALTRLTTVTTGTLILPLDLLTGGSARTATVFYRSGSDFLSEDKKEKLPALTVKTDRVTNIVNTGNQTTENKSGVSSYRGSLIRLLPENWNRRFVGTSYLTVTYQTGESAVLYSGTQVCGSACELARQILSRPGWEALRAYAGHEALINRYAGAEN